MKGLAERILAEAGKCVSCGFCEPLCPTLRPGGHRGHGPRGRVNIAILAADGYKSSEIIRAIYTCLLCAACNTACPARIDIVGVVRDVRALLAD